MPKLSPEANKTRFDPRLLFPLLCVLTAIALHELIPTYSDYRSEEYAYYTGFLWIVFAVLALFSIASLFSPKMHTSLAERSWFTGAAFLLFAVYDLATIKFQLIPAIYFPAPERIFRVFFKDTELLIACVGHSAKLLFCGWAAGALAGLTTGVLVGWSRRWNYWINPLIKVIGPIPSTAWVPIAMVAFATSFQASVFLIGLAVWFPTTVLTSSGVSGVQQAYFEVSGTLGANAPQNIFHVAIPAAMPSIFVGLFNGTTSSFLTLMTAEMMGVKYGIGWYITWQKDMLSYANVYAGLITIAVSFSLLITVLFKVRDKTLVWQKGVIKW